MSERDLFIAALQITEPAERQAWLDRACSGDAALRQRIELLLLAFGNAGSLLESPAAAVGPTIDEPITETPGTMIGPYKLLQQIGEGGMGVVWMAEQTEPVQRKVALKVIKPGMDSRQVVARFEAERQALAMMDHVNIARVFDGGATENGRPYFVMELVHGVPITKYCDDNHLTPCERLELFVPVCQAIQHAHQKGIIHRDIKPSNVMVTLYDGKPVPKVIDFGVAKATEQKLTERTLFTQYGTMVGTLEYMSPEQAEMSALGVDTRSDIYSLGVLMYELLTGSTPLSHKTMKEAAYAEILRMIKEEEPPKPSTRLSDSGEALASISANRHTEPAKLTKLVKGELDWIVMKSLDKDRNRRYETAKDFAADVQRYLEDEPVQACPPSVGYRFRKFARRNKRALVTATVLALAVLVVVGTLGWAVRDREARGQEMAQERAVHELAIQAEVKSALNEAERLQADGKYPEALSAAKRGEGLLASGGSDDLRLRVRELRRDLELVLRLEAIRLPQTDAADSKSDETRADAAYVKAFRDYGIDMETLTPEQTSDNIRARTIRLELVAALDDWARSRGFVDRANPNGKGSRTWQRLLAVARAADPDEWRNEVRDALESRNLESLRKLAGSPKLSTLPVQTLSLLGGGLEGMRDAGDLAQQVLRRAQKTYPGDFLINFQLAWSLEHRERPQLDEAIRFYTAALALRPHHAYVLVRLANLFRAKGDRGEAIAFHQAAIALSPKSFGHHFEFGYSLSYLGDLDGAIAAYRKAIELDPRIALAHRNLGVALHKQGKLDEAIAEYRKAIALDPKLALARLDLGVAMYKQGKLDEAIACYRNAIELDPKLAAAHTNLGVALQGQGKLDEAIACYRKAIEVDPKYVNAHIHLGLALADRKKLDEAIACFRKAIELDPKSAYAHNGLGAALHDHKKLDDAIACYRKAIELDPKLAKAHNNLGVALADQMKLDEAIACYRTAVELDPKLPAVHTHLGNALYRQGKLDEAIATYRKAIELDPKYAKAHSSLGIALAGQRKLDQAIACCRKAIELDAKSAYAHNGLGTALHRQGKLDEAIACYRNAIEFDPKLAAAHTNLGVALQGQGKLDEAIASHKKAVELDPKYAGAHNNLGWALHRQRKLDEAITCFRKAIEHDPTNAKFHNNLGNALHDQRKLDEAIACFRKAIELDPTNAKLHNNLGNGLHAQGKVDEAIVSFRKAIELNPKYAEPHNHLGWLLATGPDPKFRDPGRALQHARKGVELASQSPLSWQVLGWAFYRTGAWKDSIQALEKSIELQKDGGDSHQWFFLAMAHWKLDKKVEARQWYDRAVAWMEKHQPNNEESRRFRAEAEEVLGVKDKKE